MKKQHNRRIFAGYYVRYDGKWIYVVTVAKDGDTGEQIVICNNMLSHEKNQYFTMTKKSFCEMVEVNGEYVDKFVRQVKHRTEDNMINALIEDGFRGPARRNRTPKRPGEFPIRLFRQAVTYEDYAKDLCWNYLMDLRRFKLCNEQKQYIGISRTEYQILKEDLLYIKTCRETVLKEYNQYFKERFVEGKSIRKYAAEHDLNRGSVEHIQRKLITAFAAALKQRDDADGQWRLKRDTIDSIN